MERYSAKANISIEAFEAKVRKALNKSKGDITKKEAAVVTSLDLSNEHFEKKMVISRTSVI